MPVNADWTLDAAIGVLHSHVHQANDIVYVLAMSTCPTCNSAVSPTNPEVQHSLSLPWHVSYMRTDCANCNKRHLNTTFQMSSHW